MIWTDQTGSSVAGVLLLMLVGVLLGIAARLTNS